MRADSRWRRFRRRLRYWLDRGERNRLLREEMEFHIASMIDELVAQGWSEPEAHVAAHEEIWQYDATIKKKPARPGSRAG